MSHTTAPTAPDDKDLPTLRLTNEQLQKSVERLTRSHRPSVQLPVLVQPRYMSETQLQKHIHRMYDEALAKRNEERERAVHDKEATRSADAARTTAAPLSPARSEEVVHRVYDESLLRRRQVLQTLATQVSERNAAQTVRRTPAQINETTDRLYRVAMEQAREREAKLFDKYVLQPQRPSTHNVAA